MTEGHAVAMRARRLVGVRFRPQGRSVEHGLDCLGVAALAAGLPLELVPRRYRMSDEVSQALLGLDFGGRAKPLPPAEARVGDVLLVETGPRRRHFVVLVDGGFVHADARLGRVSEVPGPVAWPLVAAWRVAG
ncbi:MAG TPA: peptidoglycan endopeptidase [Allosphingosinicella sp.]|jgi:hypothetical protein